jgi:hypothetical protein
MKSSTRIDRVDQRGRTKDLLDAVEGMPSHHKAATMARIMKEVVAGTISAAEANELRKAVKV